MDGNKSRAIGPRPKVVWSLYVGRRCDFVGLERVVDQVESATPRLSVAQDLHRSACRACRAGSVMGRRWRMGSYGTCDKVGKVGDKARAAKCLGVKQASYEDNVDRGCDRRRRRSR